MRGQDAIARLTDGLDAGPQISQEDRLGDDRPEAPTFGFEDAENRAIDRFGLQARLRNLGRRLAVKKEFPGFGPFDPTDSDRAAVRFDRLGDGEGRHFDPLSGDGLGTHAHTVLWNHSVCDKRRAARRLRRRAAEIIKCR